MKRHTSFQVLQSYRESVNVTLYIPIFDFDHQVYSQCSFPLHYTGKHERLFLLGYYPFVLRDVEHLAVLLLLSGSSHFIVLSLSKPILDE